MHLVPSFVDLLQPLAAAMTVPSFSNFTTLVTGWVFSPRRTVTGMIVAAQAVGEKHHGTLHRFFARAVWSLDQLGLIVLELVLAAHGNNAASDRYGSVLLAIDDTLARKRGVKTFGVGMHRDALASSRRTTVVNWGHNWVVLAVLIRLPWREDHTLALPILFRLYLNKDAAARHRCVYRSRPELAVQLLEVVCLAHPNKQFHAVADSSYGGQSVLNHLPVNCDLTSRLVMDARLYDAPPTRRPGQNGRPRIRGQRLDSPEQMLHRRSPRREMTLYGKATPMRIADTVAHVYKTPGRPLRVVAVEPLTGQRGRQAFYSTVHEADAQEVLSWYAMRWAIEVTFHDSKQHLGFEQPQGWTRKAAERTAPLAMLLYTLVVLWFDHAGRQIYKPIDRPWYRHKTHPSFADMLATLRQASVKREVFATRLTGRGSRKTQQLACHLVQMAA
jgi:DDE superfamily endonuclease